MNIRLQTSLSLIALILSIGSLIITHQLETRMDRYWTIESNWSRVTGESVEVLLKEAIRQIDNHTPKRGITCINCETTGAITGGAVGVEVGGKAISGK